MDRFQETYEKLGEILVEKSVSQEGFELLSDLHNMYSKLNEYSYEIIHLNVVKKLNEKFISDKLEGEGIKFCLVTTSNMNRIDFGYVNLYDDGDSLDWEEEGEAFEKRLFQYCEEEYKKYAKSIFEGLLK